MGVTIRRTDLEEGPKPYKPWGGVPFINPNMVRPSGGQTRNGYSNQTGTPLWFNQTSTTTTTEPAGDKYTNIFKEKNYWIGVAVGIAGLMAYQKYFKK
jgi:hypothetical protein